MPPVTIYELNNEHATKLVSDILAGRSWLVIPVSGNPVWCTILSNGVIHRVPVVPELANEIGRVIGPTMVANGVKIFGSGYHV